MVVDGERWNFLLLRRFGGKVVLQLGSLNDDGWL